MGGWCRRTAARAGQSSLTRPEVADPLCDSRKESLLLQRSSSHELRRRRLVQSTSPKRAKGLEPSTFSLGTPPRGNPISQTTLGPMVTDCKRCQDWRGFGEFSPPSAVTTARHRATPSYCAGFIDTPLAQRRPPLVYATAVTASRIEAAGGAATTIQNSPRRAGACPSPSTHSI